MKPVSIIAVAAGLCGAAYFAWRKFGVGAERAEIRNDAAGPRLPGMPSMPGMPKMPGMSSGAAPNAPQFGPSAPAGMFNGMWG